MIQSSKPFDFCRQNSFQHESNNDNELPSIHKAKESEIHVYPVSSSPVMNEHESHHKAPNHSRPLLYVPNSLWTRLFAATVITETVLTVAIERYGLDVE